MLLLDDQQVTELQALLAAVKDKEDMRIYPGLTQLRFPEDCPPGYPKCPILDKALFMKPLVDAANDLLDWLDTEKEWRLAEYVGASDELVPVLTPREKIIGEYLDIDPVEMEKERRILLDYSREQNAKRGA